MKKEHYVYILMDPINMCIFYVGKGKGNRLKDHFYQHKNNRQPEKQKYIDNIRMLKFEPLGFKLLENLSNQEALLYEEAAINVFRRVGHPLTNKAKHVPDRNGVKLSEEHVRKIKEWNSNKVQSEAHKSRIGLANSHKPDYSKLKFYNTLYLKKDQKLYAKNESIRNPNAMPILVKGYKFNTMKEAATFFGVSVPTFKKRYEYTSFQKL